MLAPTGRPGLVSWCSKIHDRMSLLGMKTWLSARKGMLSHPERSMIKSTAALSSLNEPEILTHGGHK
jgi:hypothetical protein